MMNRYIDRKKLAAFGLDNEELLSLEPFALGYLGADTEDLETKIAIGLYTTAENIPIFLPAERYFAGWFDNVSFAVRYTFGECIRFDRDALRRRLNDYPQYKKELETIGQLFSSLSTSEIFEKSRSERETALVEMHACWGGGWMGHANPDYDTLLRLGTDGLREKVLHYRAINAGKESFYDALLITLDGFELLADRYIALAETLLPQSVGDERTRLTRLIRAFEQVPHKRPRDFFEACEFFYLAFSFDKSDSPGRFDQFLGDYYDETNEDDYACLCHLWELFKADRAWNLCIGGSDETGTDESNALSYAVLRAASQYRYNTPNLTMRVHPGTPDALWDAAIDTISTGIGMPVLYSDACVCPALEELGIPTADAHDYCMNGCNQIDIFGKSHMGLEDGEVCLAKCLEMTLFNGLCRKSGKVLGEKTGDVCSFTSFDELFAAYKTQVEAITDIAVSLSNRSQKICAETSPNPWRSLLIEGCIEKGRDYKNGGPLYGHGQILAEGIADTVDSLAAIKTLVYDEKKYAMSTLLDALNADFEGYDELYRDFCRAPKFGNNEELTDRLYKEVVEHFFRYLATKSTFRGGRFGGGCSPFNRAAAYGSCVGSLPNGKKKDSALLADAIGAVPGCDVSGTTALLNSALSADQTLAKSGHVLQLKFPKSQFRNAASRQAVITMAKVYFARSGQQITISALSAEELLDAQKHPEQHRNLIVRVGGYSDYFVNLSPALQENVIKRTEAMV